MRPGQVFVRGWVILAVVITTVQCTRDASSGLGASTSLSTTPAAFVDPRAGDGPQGRGLTVRFFETATPAPAFSILGLDGRAISSSDWRGKVVLLNFWATWCGPCREEIPALMALQQRYRGRVLIIGLSVDDGPPAAVRKFALDHQINYPVAIADSKVQDAYGGISQVPSTWVVNPDGNIVQEHRGQLDPDVTEQEVRSLLALRTDATVEIVKGRRAFEHDDAFVTDVPGVDLTGLSPQQRDAALKRLNAEKCTCGCGLTLARCRSDDSSCGVSLPAAQKVVAAIRGQ